MCAACIEYTKETLKLNEFRSALRETTREDAGHLKQIQLLIDEAAGDESKLKQAIVESGFTRK